MSTGQFGYGGVPGCCVDPVCGYQILSSYFNVSQVSRQTYIETMQPKTVWRADRKGTPTRRQPVRCQCTPHKRTFFGEEKRGVQPRLFCILCQDVWGMWRVTLSLATVGTRPGVRPCRQFIAKIQRLWGTGVWVGRRWEWSVIACKGVVSVRGRVWGLGGAWCR